MKHTILIAIGLAFVLAFPGLTVFFAQGGVPPQKPNHYCVPSHIVLPPSTLQCPTDACAEPIPGGECVGETLAFPVKGQCFSGSEKTCLEPLADKTEYVLHFYDCVEDLSGGCTLPEKLCKREEGRTGNIRMRVDECSDS